MTRIWLNHWFSTAYNIIQLIRKENPDFFIIGTNEREYPSYRILCDEFYTEPAVHDEEYLQFCLTFCKTHQIDVFMPRRGFLIISKNKQRFDEIGVKVMVDDYETVSFLNRKHLAYQELAARGVSTIPEYEIVTDADGFAAAYHNLSAKYKAVCFKFVHDEGGKSYRLIDNTHYGFAALFKKQTTRMTFDAAYAALSERAEFSPLMVMPYLPGEEISADCLQTQDGLIMLPRIKDASRVERMCFAEDILEKVREVYDAVPLKCPCNIQFKKLDGRFYFLEVNTRMSGGVQLACAASGVNIPDLAVNQLLGIHKKWHIDRTEKLITHVETPIVF